MPSLDRSRLVYSLAGSLLGGDWTDPSLKAGLRRLSAASPLRVPKLIARLLQSFARKPDYYDLVAFLRADPGLNRAIARAADVPVGPKFLPTARPRAGAYSPTRRAGLRPPAMAEAPPPLREIAIPQLATEAALAEWFGISPPLLRWRADPAGRNRRHRPGPLRTYRYRWIPRRSGLPRLLEIPIGALKRMQR